MSNYDRPIDKYPRIRDAGAWIVYSGIVPFVGSLIMLYFVAIDHQVLYSAIMAWILGMGFVATWSMNHSD